MYALSARLLHLAFQGSAYAHELCGVPQHEAVEALCGDSTEGFSLRGKILMDFLEIFSERENHLVRDFLRERKSLGERFSQREKITW